MKKILEIYKNKEISKIEFNIDQNHRKFCDSWGKSCPNSKRGMRPIFAVFSHKVIESNFDEITLNEERFHCRCCANDILLGLQNSRNGLIVEDSEVLAELRQKLNSLSSI